VLFINLVCCAYIQSKAYQCIQRFSEDTDLAILSPGDYSGNPLFAVTLLYLLLPNLIYLVKVNLRLPFLHLQFVGINDVSLEIRNLCLAQLITLPHKNLI
jgi:hypothetical protein